MSCSCLIVILSWFAGRVGSLKCSCAALQGVNVFSYVNRQYRPEHHKLGSNGRVYVTEINCVRAHWSRTV